MRKTLVRCLLLALAGGALLIPFETRLAGQAQVKMNYSDATELDLALAWTAMSPHAQVVTIGHSIDYRTAPARPVIYPIKAPSRSVLVRTPFKEDQPM